MVMTKPYNKAIRMRRVDLTQSLRVDAIFSAALRQFEVLPETTVTEIQELRTQHERSDRFLGELHSQDDSAFFKLLAALSISGQGHVAEALIKELDYRHIKESPFTSTSSSPLEVTDDQTTDWCESELQIELDHINEKLGGSHGNFLFKACMDKASDCLLDQSKGFKEKWGTFFGFIHAVFDIYSKIHQNQDTVQSFVTLTAVIKEKLLECKHLGEQVVQYETEIVKHKELLQKLATEFEIVKHEGEDQWKAEDLVNKAHFLVQRVRGLEGEAEDRKSTMQGLEQKIKELRHRVAEAYTTPRQSGSDGTGASTAADLQREATATVAPLSNTYRPVTHGPSNGHLAYQHRAKTNLSLPSPRPGTLSSLANKPRGTPGINLPSNFWD